MERLVVGPIDTIPPGTQRRVVAGGRAIAVFNVEGRFYALRDHCPHQGAPLSSGVVIGGLTAEQPGCYAFDPETKLVKCPRHGWEFELETGQSWYEPKQNRVRAYPVSVEHGAQLLEADGPERLPGSLMAETIPISVENDYVVVEV